MLTRVAVQAGESAPVSAEQRAERQPPGQPATGDAASGWGSEGGLTSGRRRQPQAARPGDSGCARRTKRDGTGIFAAPPAHAAAATTIATGKRRRRENGIQPGVQVRGE